MFFWRTKGEPATSIYEPVQLNLHSTNIRLLQLQYPGGNTNPGPIQCNLTVVPLDELPEYTAVSYAWGDPGSEETILVDGKPFRIRINLWSLLDQLRREQFMGQLWIDAVCIDQSSNFERTHQVAMMGRIYSEAMRVMVWLGPATESISEFMADLPRLEREGAEIMRFKKENQGRLGRHWEKQPILDLIELFSVAYWTRLWVLQEFVLAKEIVVRCGKEILHEHTLKWLADTMPTESLDHVRITKLLKCLAWQIIEMRFKRRAENRYTKDPVTSCEVWLNRANGLSCSDARDRIYGVLSLIDADELARSPIEPDYSKSVSQLYFDIIARGPNLMWAGVADESQLRAWFSGEKSVEETFGTSDQYELADKVEFVINYVERMAEYLGLDLGHPLVRGIIRQIRLQDFPLRYFE